MPRASETSIFPSYLLPGIIFQSVLIGGGYATGREIVEFGGKFGAWGIWAIATIFLGFTFFAIMTYEVARVFKTYEYTSWIRQLIFGLWPAFDVLFVGMTVLVLGVLSAATGSIAQEVLHWPFWLGASLVLALVAILNFYGKKVIAHFKTAGTVFLYIGYLLFTLAVVASRSPQIARALVAADTSYFPDLGLGTVVWTGLLYVGYNLAALPTTLFVLEEQRERKHSIWAGAITGLLATLPFGLTWISLLGFYPASEVLDAPVPWLRMLSQTASPGVIVLYGLVVAWTLVETCTGFIHALLDRVDARLRELGQPPLSRPKHALIAAGIVLLSGGLSRFGIIDLISQGYTAMAYGFLILMALPLLTVGLFRVLKNG
ncbi:MAG: hypothetical protein ACE5JX_05620 [Acidobacteriota bacterium]